MLPAGIRVNRIFIYGMLQGVEPGQPKKDNYLFLFSFLENLMLGEPTSTIGNPSILQASYSRKPKSYNMVLLI
jgi:hypothetical protein